MLKPVTEGWTEPIDHVLQNDGAAVLIQGFTVALILRALDGTVVDTSGKVTNLDDGTAGNKGKVRYSPGASDLLASKSHYSLRWKVTDGVGKVAFWPNGEADIWRVFVA